MLSCFKRSEREKGVWIMRLYESQGMATHAHIPLRALGIELDLDFKPFEIRTFVIRDGRAEETDLLEGAVPLDI